MGSNGELRKKVVGLVKRAFATAAGQCAAVLRPNECVCDLQCVCDTLCTHCRPCALCAQVEAVFVKVTTINTHQLRPVYSCIRMHLRYLYDIDTNI
jgi:hypothetical protein